MRRGFLSPGALLLLLGVLLAVLALIVGLKLARQADVGREVGATLVYQVEPTSSAEAEQPADPNLMEKTIAALDARVNTDWLKRARIQRLGRDKIEVAVYGADAETARRIEDLIGRTGTLEFRILANDRDHKDLIDRALAEKTPVLKSKVKDDKGEYPIVAWWVPLKGSARIKDKEKREAAGTKPDAAARERIARDAKRVGGLLSYPDICKRTIQQGDQEIDQVLVVKDDLDVTGAYLADASAGRDQLGKPCINFRFNAAGARRFGALTGNNLPEQDGQFTRKLGIILDQELNSAPSIRSTISDRGEISGEFTREEVKDLVDVLNAGELPAKIKLVEKRVPEVKTP
jgi:SecD/SecF fusion protein